MSKSLKSLIFIGVLAGCLTIGQAHAWDRDNNPPGPAGGRGTNWENPPGPRGGPGVSPDRWVTKKHWRRTYVGGVVWVWNPGIACWFPDNDQNPPGRRGGPGTNWENPPGPIGGPGASPDRTACR